MCGDMKTGANPGNLTGGASTTSASVCSPLSSLTVQTVLDDATDNLGIDDFNDDDDGILAINLYMLMSENF